MSRALARISQRLPAATADTLADTALRSVSRLDVRSSTPAAASVARLPVFLVQVGLLGMRQAVICGSLIYGSIRSRTVVL